MAGVNFDITANSAQFKQALDQAKRSFEELQRVAQSSGQGLDDTFKDVSNAAKGIEGSLKGVAAQLFSIAGISWGAMAFVRQMVQVRSEMQNTEASLKVFLGSAEKASKFMEELSDAAYWNVFEFKDLAEGASQMLAYGNAAEEVIPMLQRMSEIASGTGKDLNTLVQIYDRVKSMDSIDSRTRISLKNMGIDVIHEIAQIQGVADSAINSASLGFKDLQAAIKAVTDEGGMYFGMMQAKMDNVSDKIGTLQDAVTTMFNEMGKMTEGGMKSAIDVIIAMVENWQTLATVLETLVGVYGTYKTTMITMTAVEKAYLAVQRVKNVLKAKDAKTTALQVFWEKIQAKTLPRLASFMKVENAQRVKSIALLKEELNAQRALNIAKMSVGGLAMLAGIAGTIWAAVSLKNADAMTEEEKSIARVNKELEKQIGVKKEVIDEAENYVQVLRQETEYTNKAADALEKLRQIRGFENIGWQEFKSMSSEEIDKLLQKGTTEMNLEGFEKALDASIKKFKRTKKVEQSIRTALEYGDKVSTGTVLGDISKKAVTTGVLSSAKVEEVAGKYGKRAFMDIENAAKKVADSMYQSISGLDVEAQRSQLQKWIESMKEANKELAQNSVEYSINLAKMTTWKHNLQDLNNYFPQMGNVYTEVTQAVQRIEEATERINKIRAGEIWVVDPTEEIKKLESVVSTAKGTYKTLTGMEYSGGRNMQQYIQDYDDLQEKISQTQKKIDDANYDLMMGRTKDFKDLTDDERKALEKNVEVWEKERDEYRKTLEENGKNLQQILTGKNLTNGELANIISKDRKDLKEITEQLKTTSDPVLERQKTELENRISTYTQLYQMRNGLSQQEYHAQQARRKALREEKQLETDQIRAERIKLQRNMQDQLELLDIERREYQIANGGADLPSYELRRQNIIAQTTLSLKNLDVQTKQASEDFRMAMDSLTRQDEIRNLERKIQLENDFQEKLKLEAQYREKIVENIKAEGRASELQELRAYSDDVVAAYRAYSQITDDEQKRSFLEALSQSFGEGVTPEQVEKQLQDIGAIVSRQTEKTNREIAQKNEEFAEEDAQRLIDMTNNYLKFEQKRLVINSQYRGLIDIANKKYKDENGEFLSEEAKEAYDNFIYALELWKSNELGYLANDIRDRLLGLDSPLKNQSLSNVRKAISKIYDAIGKKQKELTADDKSFISNILGLSEEEVDFMVSQGGKIEQLLQEILDKAKETAFQFSGNMTADIGKFFDSFAKKVKAGNKSSEAFGETLKELFDIDNLGGMLSSLGDGLSQLSNLFNQFAEATENPHLSDAAEIIGGIAQNFSTAGQGAATGGWVGAIVAGVADALGQAFTAITEYIKGSKEVMRLAKQYKQELKEIRYEQELADNDDTIFGANGRGNLTAALNVMKDANEEISKQSKLFESLESQAGNYNEQYKQSAETAKKRFNSWAILFNILTAGATFGLENLARESKNVDEFYKHLSSTEQDTIDKLAGGNVKGYLEDLMETGDALGSMQIRVKKYGRGKWQTLAQLAPEIWNEDGTINTEALDAFLNTYGEKITEDQRILLEGIKQDAEAFNAAIEQALSYYEGIFSGIGDSIVDSFVESFSSGEDAIDDFTDSLEDAAEKWIKDLIKMVYVTPYLTEAQKMVEDALRNGGDPDVALKEAIGYIADNYREMEEGSKQTLAEAKDFWDNRFGTNLFSDEDEISADRGGFQAMSQDTADEMNARFTALQIEGANVVAATNTMVDTLRLMQLNSDKMMISLDSYFINAQLAAGQRLEQLRIIADNTALLYETNRRLKAIETNTNNL